MNYAEQIAQLSQEHFNHGFQLGIAVGILISVWAFSFLIKKGRD